MADVTLVFRDGSRREFVDTGRPGGSYCNRVTYEPGVVIVIDPYGAKHSFPIDLIAEVREAGERGF